jgi:predicted DsbA family dithiol-disulfide isomerase
VSDERRFVAAVEKDVADGKRAGVTGTPAFYINGRMLSGAQPVEAFVKVIEAELASAVLTIVNDARQRRDLGELKLLHGEGL